MAANKRIRIGPVALTTTLTTNILNPTITSTAGSVGLGTIAQPYVLIFHLRITNKTASAATFSLWIGATGGNAAGTEVMGGATSIPANSFVDAYFPLGLRLDAADFLVGGAGTTTALTLTGECEIGISG